MESEYTYAYSSDFTDSNTSETEEMSGQAARAETGFDYRPGIERAGVVLTFLILLTAVVLASRATNLLNDTCACSAEWPYRRNWEGSTHPKCVQPRTDPDGKACCTDEINAFRAPPPPRSRGYTKDSQCGPEAYESYQNEGGMTYTLKLYWSALGIGIFHFVVFFTFNVCQTVRKYNEVDFDDEENPDCCRANTQFLFLLVIAISAALYIFCIAWAGEFYAVGFPVSWTRVVSSLLWMVLIGSGIYQATYCCIAASCPWTRTRRF